MLLRHWHPGRLGALRMGVEHGGVCIGCCWTLMAALFALGVMSVAWMAGRHDDRGREAAALEGLAGRAVAVVLVALGLAVAIAPEQVPALTIPGSDMEMPAMSMGGPTATLVGVGAPTRRMWVTVVAQANLRGAHDPYDQAPAYAASDDDPALPGHWRARRVDRPRRCPGVRRLPGHVAPATALDALRPWGRRPPRCAYPTARSTSPTRRRTPTARTRTCSPR